MTLQNRGYRVDVTLRYDEIRFLESPPISRELLANAYSLIAPVDSVGLSLDSIFSTVTEKTRNNVFLPGVINRTG